VNLRYGNTTILTQFFGWDKRLFRYETKSGDSFKDEGRLSFDVIEAAMMEQWNANRSKFTKMSFRNSR